MYQALYRKWRPKIFEDVFGQAHITGTLKNQIVSDKLSHAYLFSGTRGTGKTTAAKILARAVNCENPIGGNPCNECYACKAALAGTAVDIVEMDAASNNKVEDARMIRDEVIYAPSELKYKVYIIDEAHMLTQSAFNALLKTLEEPPSHVIFIFATTEPQKFPATILSRCQRFDFKRIAPYDISRRVKQILEAEGCEITDDAINIIVRAADGSMRDALSLLDQCVSLGGNAISAEEVSEIVGVTDPKFVFDFAKSIINGNISDALLYVKQAYEKGFDFKNACDEILECFRNIMIAKSLPKKEDVTEVLNCSESETNTYCAFADELSLERILRYIDMLDKAVNSETFSVNPRLSLEIALTGMVKRPNISEPEGMLEKIAELENRVRRLEKGRPAVVLRDKAEEKIQADVKAEIQPEQSEKAEEKPEPEEIRSVSESEAPTPKEENTVENEINEIPDYPIPDEEFVPESDESGDLKEVWGDVLVIASKNSLAGFDTIIKSASVTFSGNTVNVAFESDGFFKIAQMNKFDENIVNAYKSVGIPDVNVKMSIGKAKPEENDNNFGQLMKKIRNSGNAEFF